MMEEKTKARQLENIDFSIKLAIAYLASRKINLRSMLALNINIF